MAGFPITVWEAPPERQEGRRASQTRLGYITLNGELRNMIVFERPIFPGWMTRGAIYPIHGPVRVFPTADETIRTDVLHPGLLLHKVKRRV